MARILFVNLEGRIGGAEMSMLLMVKHLRKDFEIVVVCPARSVLSKSLAFMKIDFHELPNSPRYRYSSIFSIAYWLKTSWSILRIAFKVNPDIIHANSFYAGGPAVLAALITRKKLVLHARDLADFGLLLKFYSYFCQKVIAISKSVKSMLVHKGIKPDKIRVVYNGVDKSDGTINENRDLLNTPIHNDKHPFVFANIGQFVPWKNQTHFLKAASLIVGDLPNARFMLVGDDIFGRDSEYKKSLLSHVGNVKLKERVDFLGWQEDMSKVWPKINCLVHTANREPFGRVIVEAMAHRIPVIAIDSCGPGEIIQNGVTGILIQPDDVNELRDAMLKIAQHTKFTNILTKTGYEHVMSNFTAEKTAEQVRKVYTKLLAM